MYQFPTWKYWLVLIVLGLGLILALPNVFGEDPALQLARDDRAQIDEFGQQRLVGLLETAGVTPTASYIEDGRLVLRFENVEDQLQARDALLQETGREYVVALTNASRTPGFLRRLGLKPMSLGLDLRGGVYFLYEVDIAGALTQALERIERDFRSTLREERIPYASVVTERDAVRVTVRDPAQVDAAVDALSALEQGLVFDVDDSAAGPVIVARMTPEQVRQRQDFAIQQNITTLRNRVNELGVSEPIVARQGLDRIVVQLPGVQDPNEAIRVLGATATLEFRLVDEANDPYEAERTKRAPLGSKLYFRRDGAPVLLKRDIIVSGDQLTDATAGFSEGQPAVFVKLDGRGAQEMLETTQENVGRGMAVVFIEKKRLAEGEPCAGQRSGRECTEEEVISVATIRGVFSSSFQITGLMSGEAGELALLLRAGSLAAPIYIVEQRTIGPSLGRDNIEKGARAMVIGLLLTFAFMAFYYRGFGWIANAVLIANIVLLTALLSLFQASLTLPGIAGVVLTVGMAVDANILIYERIREELRLGNSPQAAINAGFDKAFSAIADANVTTLIAGIVLFTFGTGPIKGFAVVLSLGIVTSMFTAIVGSRALIHAIWGRRRIQSLPI
ncbi:MAG TPA: protein translocase subunit SecD [Steroidobacteraceae bacterium]|nr:protein translocase subunit SecD [Steroidobacteraceae bacterium]